MQPNQPPLVGLAAMLADLATVKTEGHPNLPRKPRDKDDIVLGVVPVEMQKLWLLREKYRLEVDELVSQVEDTQAAYRSDRERLGRNLLAEIEQQYQATFDGLTEKMAGPYQKFMGLDLAFDAAVLLEYSKVLTGSAIIGMRQGFELVARKNDMRGDLDNPVNRLRSRSLRDVLGSLVAVSLEILREKPASEPETAPDAATGGK